MRRNARQHGQEIQDEQQKVMCGINSRSPIRSASVLRLSTPERFLQGAGPPLHDDTFLSIIMQNCRKLIRSPVD